MDEQEVQDLLSSIPDPRLGNDIVSLGLVNSITIEDSTIKISLVLGAPYSTEEQSIAKQIRDLFSNSKFEVEISARSEKNVSPEDDLLPTVKNVIAVASGKGGVGKSTVSVNLATELARLGARVGLFDADVYGPNTPRMIGHTGEPIETKDGKIQPPEQFGVKFISLGLLVGENDPVIWRGPMVHKIISQLLSDVNWGALDYLIIDLPPGTGDAQLTLLQIVSVTGAVIVTTPQSVVLDDAEKSLKMFDRHGTPTLGLVENLSGFLCPSCNTVHDLFGTGTSEIFANELELPFLGRIQLDPLVRKGSDDGFPAVLNPDSIAQSDFQTVCQNIINNVGALTRKLHSDNYAD